MTNRLRVTLWLLLWVRSAQRFDNAPPAAITAKVASRGENAAELDTPTPGPELIPQPELAGTNVADGECVRA